MKMIWDLIVFIIASFILRSEGQSCVDTVNVRQIGDNSASHDTQVIVPRSNFSYNGRVTGYLISLQSASSSGGYPSIQVWHPTSSTEYTRVDTECALTASDISMMRDNGDDYYLGNVSCTGNNRIEFQSGDVIGYHHGSEVRYVLWSIGNNQYRLYRRTGRSNPLNSFNINNADDYLNEQPLIQVMYDIRCDNLLTPANGSITSCTSGRVGVGYEGDTCSFTCNTGYELTGSDTRTCQSDGSWSGSDVVCRRVTCSSLTDPNNGMIYCSLGDDGVPSYEDTCSFTCNTGYELTGSDTRTCQSDGSWSGTVTTCTADVNMFSITTSFMLSPATSDVSTTMTTLISSSIFYVLHNNTLNTATTDMSITMTTLILSSIIIASHSDMLNTATTVISTAATTPTSSSAIQDVPRLDNSGSSSDSGAIIGGVVGGVILLLIIIVVLCIVILCMRRSHRKRESEIVDNKTHLNTDVTLQNNPSYDVTKTNTVDYYSYETIKPGDSDIPITANPSYNVHTKPYGITSEDEYNYVQPNEFIQHSDIDGSTKTKPGSTDVPITTNPSYNVHTKPCSKTSEENYNYVQPNKPVQHSDGYITITDQSHGIREIRSHHLPKQDEYGVINQPQS